MLGHRTVLVPAQAEGIIGQQGVANGCHPIGMIFIAPQGLSQTLRVKLRQGFDQILSAGAGYISPAKNRIEVVIGTRSIPAFAPGPLNPMARTGEQMPTPVQTRGLRPTI